MIRDFLIWLSEQDHIRNQGLAFAFGASIALVLSFFSETRRSCKMLVAGSVLGGVGAVIAFRVWKPEWWLPVEIGLPMAAIGFERIALAWQRVTDDFSKNPFSVARRLLALFVAYGTALKNVKLDDEPVEPLIEPEQLSPEDFK